VQTVLDRGIRTADLMQKEGEAPASTAQAGDAVIAALDESL
jgi:3-isopropylmalate dehydrogenase